MKFKFYLQDTVERTLVIDIPTDRSTSYQSAADYLREHLGSYALPYGEIQKTYTAIEKMESAENRIQENESPFFLEACKGSISIYETNCSVWALAEIKVRNGCTSTHFPSTKMASASDYCQAIEVLKYAAAIADSIEDYKIMMEGNN